tara:strand:+ start:127 stop:270 length:144 start_codon:yes stop_codon:yes gene_type:complete
LTLDLGDTTYKAYGHHFSLKKDSEIKKRFVVKIFPSLCRKIPEKWLI